MFIPGDLVDFAKWLKYYYDTNTIKPNMKEDWIWPQMYFRVLLSVCVNPISRDASNLSLTHTHKKISPDICA